MIKEVKIGDSVFTLKSSVGTIKDFKQLFNKDFIDVIQKFSDLQTKSQNMNEQDKVMFWLKKLVEMNEDVLQLAYTMILEAKQKGYNSNFAYGSYDEWVTEIERIDLNSFRGVLECASNTFLWSLQKK